MQANAVLCAHIVAQSYLAIFLRKLTNDSIANPVYIEFEMGCKLLMDHAEDTHRVSLLMVS